MSVGITLLGGEAVPPDSFGVVFGDTFSRLVHDSEIRLSAGITLLGGEAVPPDSFGVVFGDTFSRLVHDSEIRLSAGITLLGGEAVPPDSFGVVFGDTFSRLVHDSEIRLSAGITLLGGEAVPPDTFGVVFGDTFSRLVHEPEIVLCLGHALLSRAAVPYGCFVDAYRHTFTALMHDPKLKLGSSVAILGEKEKLAKGGGEVALLIRRHRVVQALCCALVADQQTGQHYNHEIKFREPISSPHGLSLLLADVRYECRSDTAMAYEDLSSAPWVESPLQATLRMAVCHNPGFRRSRGTTAARCRWSTS